MSLSNLATSVRTSWDRYRTYRASIRELNSLDDRHLADIGIERSRIRDVARAATY